MKECLYYKKAPGGDNSVICLLCPNKCAISDGRCGRCGARKNISGVLYALTYGKISSISIDPVEKKPLFNFYPGSVILSAGSVGCNFLCPWCQNSDISRASAETFELREILPTDLITLAKEYGSIGMAYTYNEPLINYEFVKDSAEMFRAYKMKNVLVTNGYICEEPFSTLLPYIDAANVDIKFFSNESYKKICGGEMGAPIRTIEALFRAGKHVEVTVCVVPKLNDSEELFRELVDWLWSLSPDAPLHLSRYFPSYKYSAPPTSVKTLHRLREIAVKKLNYVYLGNVLEESNTYCPSCKTLLIKRKGYNVEKQHLDGNRCMKCGETLNIV